VSGIGEKTEMKPFNYTFADFRKSFEFIKFYVLTEVNKIKGFIKKCESIAF